ncbi:uncharacterized protein LOC112179015 isoform X3 [Rosa chinensis]|uniref:uncharacterized protein LOC112179015 isoform X3 n=1 Tax=Rosa chinensis TaxID=74649 RepID=UPI001AD930C6|nr:uncharacterized protein LOC112179015 isoform X3 [Rosa chinensis]
MAAAVVPNGIVPEVLKYYNFEDWSIRVKTYLLGKELWEVVVGTETEQEDDKAKSKAWRKNNAKALHVIQFCCGDDAFSCISGLSTAKEAWQALEEEFKRPGVIEFFGEGDRSNFFHHLECRNWDAAMDLIRRYPNLIRARIPSTGMTILHMVVLYNPGNVSIVNELMQLMKAKDLEIRDTNDCTALTLAIEQNVDIQIAHKMVEKNKSLLTMWIAPQNRIPVGYAFAWNNWKMVDYLYPLTPPEALNSVHGAELLTRSFCALKFDMALDLIQRYPNLATVKDNHGGTPLAQLAGMRCAFLSGSQLKFWEKWIYNGIRIEGSPPIDNQWCCIFPAGRVSPFAKLDKIQGAALQMQRELQWFKEVEKIVPFHIVENKNFKERKTARELFTENHKELVKAGESSMKDTATSCTVVGALIVTIMFAAAFTVPGGNNGNSGAPMFLNKRLFMVFIASDAISLFSSTTSIMIFLGIFTSRYAEDDFLKSLPTKMIVGLLSLFLSVTSMMIAFASALFLMLHEPWIVGPLSFLASVPIITFVWMQTPLFIATLKSTYGKGIFNNKLKRRN